MTPPIAAEQREQRLEAFRSCNGNITAAARLCGISRSGFGEWAAKEGLKANPMVVTGRSTLRNADGEVVMEWEKTSRDLEEAQEAREDALAAMLAEIPRATPIVGPAITNADLCNLYTFTDFHLGMLAWHREGGADWDLAIAERTLIESFALMMQQSPPAHTAIINLQGDFLHTDGFLPETPASKHILDADGRYPKLRKVAIRGIRQLVRMALEHHAHVHVIVAEGNHDESGSGWLTDVCAVHYECEPRVSVDDSDLPFYVFKWGETFLGFHHGHKVKNEQLPMLFSAQYRRLWGETTRAYLHCGHRHHCDEKEYNGAIVIQHPTLAARDAYAARGGWIADRAAQSITYHKRFGQVGRVFVTPEMLAA